MREKHILKHLSVEHGADKSEREFGSKKDLIFFLQVQREKLSG